MSYQGKVEKTMEAETVGLLNHMLQTALNRIREENNFDIVMFLGVDGRIFATSIPDKLDNLQYQLLNMVKSNLPHICSQLTTKNLTLSIQQYESGSVIISGVGDKAFLVFIMSKQLDDENMGKLTKKVLNISVVIKHLMEVKPITNETTLGYDDEVIMELRKLSRLLFVEKFDSTRQYKKNKEIHNYIRNELSQVLEKGLLDEVITLAYNEIGTSSAFMTDRQWEALLNLILEEVRKLSGDVVAERCARKWKTEVERLLRSFV